MKKKDSPKKKLVILLGAGASIPFGMPSTEEIGKFLKKVTSEDPTKRWCLVKNSEMTLYEIFEKQLKYAGVFPSFEKVIDRLLVTADNIKSANSSEYDELYHNWVTQIIITSEQGLPLDMRPQLYQWSLREYHAFLIEKLTGFISNKCHKINHPNALIKLFRSLRKTHDFAIITLNYDNLALKAARSLDGLNFTTGYENRDFFSPENVFDASNDGFSCFLHLHGSIHLRLQESFFNDDTDNSRWDELPNNLNSTRLPFGTRPIEPLYLQLTQDGRHITKSPIIWGLRKSDQLLSLPFRTYHSHFDKLAAKADALLVIGYSFSDRHVNKIIRQIFLKKNSHIVNIDKLESNLNYASALSKVLESLEFLARPFHPNFSNDKEDGWLTCEYKSTIKGMAGKFSIYTSGLSEQISDEVLNQIILRII